MNKTFVAIGHISSDLEPEPEHVGGGVTYSAIAAQRLGFASHIITKLPPNHPYISELEARGITVHALPTRQNSITTFKTSHDVNGKRTAMVTESQESITLEDFPSFPVDILSDAIILIAPVIGEVDTALFPKLKEYGYLAITPQGYFRKINNDGSVASQEWSGFETYLPNVDIVILSEEDILFYDNPNTFLERIKQNCTCVVVTKGKNGVDIYSKESKIHTNIFQLAVDEVKDVLGAGDTYATAFITKYRETNDLRNAAAFAALYAALKIKGLGNDAKNFGIDTIPTLQQTEEFVKKNKNRVESFYRVLPMA